MELIKNIAAVVGCVSACIGLLVTIFKPLRQRLVDAILTKSQHQKMTDDIAKLDQKFDAIAQKLDVLIEEKEDVIKRLDRVEKNVLLNESDRLKSELARYAAMCRRGEPIYEADYLHIQEVYEKYHIILKGNHTGTDDFETIKEYFEKQNITK